MSQNAKKKKILKCSDLLSASHVFRVGEKLPHGCALRAAKRELKTNARFCFDLFGAIRYHPPLGK